MPLKSNSESGLSYGSALERCQFFSAVCRRRALVSRFDDVQSGRRRDEFRGNSANRDTGINRRIRFSAMSRIVGGGEGEAMRTSDAQNFRLLIFILLWLLFVLIYLDIGHL